MPCASPLSLATISWSQKWELNLPKLQENERFRVSHFQKCIVDRPVFLPTVSPGGLRRFKKYLFRRGAARRAFNGSVLRAPAKCLESVGGVLGVVWAQVTRPLSLTPAGHTRGTYISHSCGITFAGKFLCRSAKSLFADSPAWAYFSLIGSGHWKIYRRWGPTSRAPLPSKNYGLNLSPWSAQIYENLRQRWPKPVYNANLNLLSDCHDKTVPPVLLCTQREDEHKMVNNYTRKKMTLSQ